jgi:hypothetical protein
MADSYVSKKKVVVQITDVSLANKRQHLIRAGQATRNCKSVCIEGKF